MYITRPAMLAHFQFEALGLRWGRGLWVATSLAAGFFCVSCERVGEEVAVAPEVEAPVSSINKKPEALAPIAVAEPMTFTDAVPEVASGADADGAVDLHGLNQEMIARIAGVRKAGKALQTHREKLVAGNEEMARAWQEVLGGGGEAEEARAKIMAFYQSDAEGMALEEIYMAELEAFRKVRTQIGRAMPGEGEMPPPAMQSAGVTKFEMPRGMRPMTREERENRGK